MSETSAAPAKRFATACVDECGYCSGEGSIKAGLRTFPCRACDGRGAGQTVTADAVCPHCRGSGFNATQVGRCQACTGTGVRNIVDWRVVFGVGTATLGGALFLSTLAPGLLIPSAIFGCMGATLMGISVHSGRQRLSARQARAELAAGDRAPPDEISSLAPSQAAPMNQSPVSPMPAMKGARFAPCRVCEGGGLITLCAFSHQQEFPCLACEGRGCGQIVPEQFVCPFCLGAGKNAHGRPCRRCKGLGHKRSMGPVEEGFATLVAVAGVGLACFFGLKGGGVGLTAVPVVASVAGAWAVWRTRRQEKQIKANRLAWQNASVEALPASSQDAPPLSASDE